MKKNKFYLNLLAVGIMAGLMFGCSETGQFTEDAIPASVTNEVKQSEPVVAVLTKSEAVALAVQQKGTYKIEEDEALDNLNRFYVSDLEGEETDINITEVVLRKNPETEKDLYYEVVFESDKGTGFSILSADERTDDILCYSEVGSISDTSFNKSLKFCLELIDLYVEEQTKEDLAIDSLALSARAKFANANVDIVSTKAYPPFDPNDPNSPWYYGRTDVTTTVSERLKAVTTSWHQGSPYNALLPLLPPDYTDRAAAGCAMIAVTQIMAYHKKPFSNYITTAMWPSMIDNPNGSVELKNLIRDAFYDMYISYDATGTTSNMSKARSFLNSNGYTAGSAATYSYTGVWNALNYGPAYMDGNRTTQTGETVGHAWVVDGARTTTTQTAEIYYCLYNGNIIEITGNSYSSTTKKVKCNWGWGNPNNQNGDPVDTWFNDNVFIVSPNGEVRNYNIDLQIMSSIQ